MNNTQRQPTPAEQINAAQQRLVQAQVDAYEAKTALDAAEVTIRAIRNLLQGAGLGQKFEQEQAAKKQDQPVNLELGDADL